MEAQFGGYKGLAHSRPPLRASPAASTQKCFATRAIHMMSEA